jgi:hypothetical protein
MVVHSPEVDLGSRRNIAQGSRLETLVSKELLGGIQDAGLGIRAWI